MNPSTTKRSRSLAFTALSLWLLGSATLCADLAAQPIPGRKFGDMVGLGVKFSQGQPLAQLSMLTDLNVRWVRDSVYWADMEPTRGSYREFPASFRQRLDFYRANGIGLVYVLAYANEKAYPATPDNPQRPADAGAFARYAVEIARQLKASGVQFVLEIWNEPHHFVLRQLLGGTWNGAPPSPWLDHYVRMVREVVKQVKAYDPSIKLLSDDDMWVIHYWFLEKGLPKELDGFAFHPYTKGLPELTAVAQDTSWVKPFVVVDADRSFSSAVRRLRERGQAKLGRKPELWVTEWGWEVGGPLEGGGTLTEQRLAAFLPRAFLQAFISGVQVMCWFSSQDRGDGAMGLTTNEGRKRSSYVAFKTVTAQLGDYVFVEQLAGLGSPARGVQALLFRGPRDHKLVIWNVDGAAKQLRLSGPLRSAVAVDVLGRALSPRRDATGNQSLTIGEAPIYLGLPSGSGIAVELVAD